MEVQLEDGQNILCPKIYKIINENINLEKEFSKFHLSKNHRCHSSIVDYSLQLLGIKCMIPDDMRVLKVTVK